jgi:hypothetical protein
MSKKGREAVRRSATRTVETFSEMPLRWARYHREKAT